MPALQRSASHSDHWSSIGRNANRSAAKIRAIGRVNFFASGFGYAKTRNRLNSVTRFRKSLLPNIPIWEYCQDQVRTRSHVPRI